MNNEHTTREDDWTPPLGRHHTGHGSRNANSATTDDCDNRDNYDKSYFEQRRWYPTEENRNGNYARKIWGGACPIKGTAAEQYLLSRRIRGSSVSSLAYARLNAGKSNYHCLVARVQNAVGETCAISRTFLSQDGKSKANIEAPRRSLGAMSGGAVRLGQVQDQVILCEGLEDGLTLQQRLGIPVWVALGTSFLPKVELPPSVTKVIVAQDNDEPGAEAAEETAKVWFERGCESSIMRPPSGFKDFNELLMSLPLSTGGFDIPAGERL